MREIIAASALAAIALFGTSCTRGDAPRDGAASRDGTSSMVAIPAGKALLGCNAAVDAECENDEPPGGLVELAAFEIDATEVTVAEYRACVDAGACSAQGLELPSSGKADRPELVWTCNWGKPDRDRHPINCLDWNAAVAFCTWAKKRLPTANEWERTARGTDGRRYPWGNDEPTPEQAVFGQVVGKGGKTAPVGTTPGDVSPFGLFGMAGNILEWCADWHGPYPANDAEPLDNPLGPPQGLQRIQRGGCWAYEAPALRTTARTLSPPSQRLNMVGFRIVVDATPDEIA